MSNKEKAPLVPKLRFPEFRGSDGWGERKISDVLSPAIREIAKPSSRYLAVGIRSHGKGTFHKPDQEPEKNSMDRLYLVHRDDLIVSITFAWEGAIAIASDVDHGGYVSHRFPTYAFKLSISTPTFFRYVISNIAFTYQLALISPGGAGRNRVMNKKDFLEISVVIPSLLEQTKIADCLSSLDELIAAQARKVDALKTHKKGLMQQILPRDGETKPRLRFPEFRDAPDWERGSLGDVFETTSGGTPSRSEKKFWDGDVPWITTSLVNFGVITGAEEFISEAGLKSSSTKLFPIGTVVIAMYGQGKTRGQVALLGIEAATNQACAAVLPKKGIHPYFVFLNLGGRYQELRRLSNSGGQENLSQGLIRAIPFAYPQDDMEQQRIVDFLTSLDDLITDTTQELETLKTCKKGLMQQLFPSADGLVV